MFPLEVNLLIGILIVAIIPTYILILKKLRPALQKKLPNQNTRKQHSKSRKKNKKAARKSGKTAQSDHSRFECPYQFGYLRTLPKNASLPDECVKCSKALDCLRHQPKVPANSTVEHSNNNAEDTNSQP